ncbi:hypothetical protein [Piscirickettsia salmonis]|uniref:hypothetical protein n=1 Tax=Piscirickettsia salmonis TaxID=1238 RepID=UPI001EE35278|nr:hypothetical protein [Piscirickettsia salmonis]
MSPAYFKAQIIFCENKKNELTQKARSIFDKFQRRQKFDPSRLSTHTLMLSVSELIREHDIQVSESKFTVIFMMIKQGGSAKTCLIRENLIRKR